MSQPHFNPLEMNARRVWVSCSFECDELGASAAAPSSYQSLLVELEQVRLRDAELNLKDIFFYLISIFCFSMPLGLRPRDLALYGVWFLLGVGTASSNRRVSADLQAIEVSLLGCVTISNPLPRQSASSDREFPLSGLWVCSLHVSLTSHSISTLPFPLQSQAALESASTWVACSIPCFPS